MGGSSLTNLSRRMAVRRGQIVSIPAITNRPTTMAADWPGRFAYLNGEEAVDRLSITNPETVRALQRCAAGIKGEPVPSEVGRDDAFFKSMSEQRRVPRKRPKEAYARDLTFRSGERWLWDISAAFECAFDSVRAVPRDLRLPPLGAGAHLPREGQEREDGDRIRD